MKSPFEEIPREEREVWNLSPTTIKFLSTVRRTLAQKQAEIVLMAEAGDADVDRMRALGGQTAALKAVLRLAGAEVSFDVA
jgi:hypothetical protein